MVQLMVSFRGTNVPEDVLRLVEQGEVAAICLFTFNVESPTQLRALTQSIYDAAKKGNQPTPIIGIDQEGGQLIAIRGGATELPGNMALGATRSPELAEQAGRVLARELLAMGVNMNFAPSLDVNVNPLNPVIGIRSFGDNPQLVAELGAAQIRGMQAEGVIATAKHFPGHGDTSVDSHLGVPVVAHDFERLQEVEIAPFRRAIEEDVTAIMSSHIQYDAIDPELVATISPRILTNLLRQELHYAGLIVTDAMDMHAVARLGTDASITSALKAGADLIILGHVPDQVALVGRMKPSLNHASIARIQQVQQKLPTVLPDLSLVGAAEHLTIAQEIADRSITLVHDTPKRLPLGYESLAVVTVTPKNLTPADTSADATIRLAEAIQKRRPEAVAFSLPYQAGVDEVRALLESTSEFDRVIVGTIAADQDRSQADFVNGLIARGQKHIVVALRTPYDVVAFPQVETYLCAYGLRDVTTEAVARVLFGEIEATGVLPCAIPGLMPS